jgi:hypothetical protein
MSRLEGQLVDAKNVAVLKRRFDAINDKCKATIKEISEEAFGAISMNPPTERRVGIARVLLEIAEQDSHIDKDLVRSLCELRTGKKYPNAGLALTDLSWIDAERVWSSILDIYADRVQLEYVPASNHYIIKEHKHVR